MNELVPVKKKKHQDVPLRPREGVRGIIDIYKNLEAVGAKYPLVVLTNDARLLDPATLKQYPNLVAIPVTDDDILDRGCKMKRGHEIHFQKLRIFQLTQYEKLLWLDTDIAFKKNADRLFNYNTHSGSVVYGQIDDYGCRIDAVGHSGGGFCSGLMLLQPIQNTFDAIMKKQKHMKKCWGDQTIIHEVFTSGGRSVRLFPRSIVNFEHCHNKMDVFHFSGSPRAKRVPQFAPGTPV